MIEFDGVSKRYGEAVALHSTTLSVRAGGCTALIGPSGCGKSTLLRLAIGLIYPDTGETRVMGTVVSPETALQLRHKMGYVIQDGGLFPHLTAEQNAAIFARRQTVLRDGWRKRLIELCELTRFPVDLLARYPTELSGGQRQRVSLMRALMHDPDVLLLDEPLGALDPMVRVALQQDLKQIFAALGKTTLMVTHDLAEAAYLADEIVLMREGRVVQQGAFSVLAANPASPFVTEFIAAQRSLVEL